MVWRLHNRGAAAVDVAVLGTPLGFDGVLDATTVRVMATDPAMAAPINLGIRVKMADLQEWRSASAWIHLEAGQSFETPLDIENGFEFKGPGNYSAMFAATLYVAKRPLGELELPFKMALSEGFEMETVVSAPVFFMVSQEMVSASRKPAQQERVSYSGCSAYAGALANIMINYATGVQFCLDKLKAMNPSSQPSRDQIDYDVWFGHIGTGDIGSPYSSSQDTYSTVLSTLTSINNMAASGSYNVVCKACDDPAWYAYVQPSVFPRVINLCTGRAFSGAFELRIPDSVPGVLIHETSHFFNTDDSAYGITGAMSLVNACRASTQPLSRCARNADNYEYFCENLGSKFNI
ncbi:MAG: M35 family metallo-endopeptidase [archaeon]|nr:M35 family metallo-endopeptidase [archaeon]